MAIKLHPSFAVHPGAWLRAEIAWPHGLSVTGAAETLRVTRQAMSYLLNGRAGLSAEMSIRFEKAFGVRTAHDLALTREGVDGILVEPAPGYERPKAVQKTDIVAGQGLNE